MELLKVMCPKCLCKEVKEHTTYTTKTGSHRR